MRRWMTWGAIATTVACGSSSGGGGSSGTTSGGIPLPSPQTDGGSDAGAVVSIFAPCANAPAKPLTAGSQTDAQSGATLHWPTPWTAVTGPSSGAAASTTYQYVPTNATTSTGSTAAVSMSTSGVSGDAQGAELLTSAESFAKNNLGDAKRITFGGHDAVIWWDEEAPPQPGCQGCPGDPGPDNISIGLTVYLGPTPEFGGGRAVLEARGSARKNAVPQDIFCDMEQMVLGITLAR